ncbi:hypothetical protein PCASD_03857 [Puccinia coronata f. sp. avenae]|uniref:Retrotransposon gag domain-containing protein n=1 Tax=Puccinia coronata f. sp. avenae TaxID=200324 RepID=A0A2N5V2U3_9BASI|nr:hypothetical protein PCASD_03857 [Puccinia coronata f. sp. avenae]
MSLPTSPNPHTPRIVSLPPSPNPHFRGDLINYLSPSPQPQIQSPQGPSPPLDHGLPPISPAPEGFVACDINSDTCFGQHFDSDGRLADTSVNNLLAEMRIDNKPVVDVVAANTQHIAELQTNSCCSQKDIKELKGLLHLSSDVVKIKTTMKQEITQLRAEMAHARGVIDALGASTTSRMEHLESITTKEENNASKVKFFRKPPSYSHIFFSGDVKETNPFCFFIRNTFERLTEHFLNEKHRILWIAGYFRSANRRMGDWCPSYNWWRGLLGKNAHVQGFDAATGSSSSIFVIKELMTSSAFLSAIKYLFSNNKEFEDARKALKLLKQKGEPIEQFNITFNSLLYSVDLSDASKCEIYAEAINPEIVNLGLQRGGWTGVTDLNARQAMAVILAIDVAKVVALERNRAKGITARVEQCLNSAPNRVIPAPKPAQQAKLTDGTPMDLDAIQANSKFTYALFKAECIELGIGARCGGNFDSFHEENGGCPVSVVDQLTLGDKLTMWKNWGGYVQTKKEKKAVSTTPLAPMRRSKLKVNGSTPQEQLGKGKKRETIAEMEEGPTIKRRESKAQYLPSSSGSQEVAGVEMEPLSIGDILFERQIATAVYEESNNAIMYLAPY